VRAVEKKRRLLGDEHPDMLPSMANLASTCSNQGQQRKSKELKAIELGIYSNLLGEKHLDALTSMAKVISPTLGRVRPVLKKLWI
jgi:hypothetical protein